MASHLLRSLGLLSAVALIPITTAALAVPDTNTLREIDQFADVFEKVRAQYVDKVDDKTLIEGAISGMLGALDPHSSYMDARDFKNLQTQTDGFYGGLGLSVTMEDGAVKVIAPTEDSPGYKAGIKAGDYITDLDGQPLYGATLDEAVDKMRGNPGTKIRLTIVRPGRDKPFDVTLTREIIQLKPVKWEVKDRVGIININTFTNRNTATDVKAAIAGIDKAIGGKPLGYVIDLRSNPGGLLDQAIDVSDVFLDHGEVVSQRGREKGDIERYYAKPGDMAEGLPIVVLVDAGSASAAEIVAGALQDQKRALVMGERSFGKGSVQSVVPLSDGAALRLTTARYYTPAGRSVQEGGIEPDVPVPQLSDADYKSRPRIREIDLRRHFINSAKVDDKVLEDDGKTDPRFAATSTDLAKRGIDDYQLYYAVQTLARLAKADGGGAVKASRR